MSYTTIQISKSTRESLNSLKSSPRQSYDELLNELLSLVPKGDDEGEYTSEFRISLLRGLLDVQQGRTISHEEMKKKLGII